MYKYVICEQKGKSYIKNIWYTVNSEIGEYSVDEVCNVEKIYIYNKGKLQ